MNTDCELIVVEGGGHDWQIEGADADVNELVWSFLSRFSLPA